MRSLSRESQLWKVETIGDSFMVAAGLDMAEDEGSGSLEGPGLLSRVMSCRRADEYSAARAAINFGSRALGVALKHTM